MAVDNVTTQSSTLATIPDATKIATDNLAGGEVVQLVKLLDGTANSDTPIAGDASNGLDVDVTRVQGSVAVTGTFWQATQPISAASLPLPTGAATAAKQPALGTAGTPSTDVITVQGIASGTAQVVDTELTTDDFDSGGGTDTIAKVGVAFAASGGSKKVSSADPLPVTVISGVTNVQHAEDAAHASGDTGTMALGVRKDTATALAGSDGDYQPAIFDASGRMHVNVGNTVTVSQGLSTSGGASIYEVVSAASTNTANIKASAGQIYGLLIFNLAAGIRYVKFHNTAGTPTAGSGVVLAVQVPANSAGSGVVISFPFGIAFSTGIGISMVTGIANSDSAAVGASELLVNVLYN